VFVAVEDNGDTPVMLAPLDGRTAPRRLSMMDAIWVYFGGKGEVVFQSDLMYRIKEDGSDLRSISPTRSLNPFSVSPDGQWVPAAEGPVPEDRNVLKVYPVGGGPPRLICRCYPPPNLDDGPGPAQLSWAPDGRFLYLKFDTSIYAIPLKPGEMLPSIPPSGFPSKEAVAAVPGARLISEDRVFPGPNPSLYAFMKVSAQRNIYRVPVP
jgi:hypothetical protein